MIVVFARKGRKLAEAVMDAVPCGGQAVTIGEGDAPEVMMVWNVAWQVAFGEQPPRAFVELRTRQEYMRAIYGREDQARAERQ